MRPWEAQDWMQCYVAGLSKNNVEPEKQINEINDPNLI